MHQTKVLLAEDDLDHQRILIRALTEGRQGVLVKPARTGREVVDLVHQSRRDPFDCIILDFNLPDYQAHELILALGERCESPVIVISSSNAQSIVVHSLRNGCVDFMHKEEAIQADRLWRSVRKSINKHRAEHAERRSADRRIDHFKHLAETDPLTGLANRRHLYRLLAARRGTLDRRGETACVLLDLDDFKHINDTFGHAAGDQVLSHISGKLRAASHKSDIVCRWGGDEFISILVDSSPADAILWAEALRCQRERETLDCNGKTISVTLSGGVASASSSGFNETIIEQADQALYLAKSLGRNRICAWAMVEIEKALDTAENLRRSSKRQKLSRFLEAIETILGPTQREHLTSHSERVCNFAVRLGRALDMNDDDLDRLQFACLCHDIGKALIPESILAKPASLSASEQRVVSRHAEDGARIVKRLGGDEKTASYIRNHHANFDDKMSRNGPSVYDTSGGAGILKVADALVAMTCHRPYRAARSISSATREMLAESGRQFDPNVTNAAVRMILAGDFPAVNGRSGECVPPVRINGRVKYPPQ